MERHDAIQTFKPEPFWTLQVVVQVTEFRKLTLDWDRVRIFDREVAVMFHQKIKDAKQAKYSQFFYLSLKTSWDVKIVFRLIKVSQKEKAKQRPQALNTVELMRVASSGLNMSPHHAMTLAERLYTQVSELYSDRFVLKLFTDSVSTGLYFLSANGNDTLSVEFRLDWCAQTNET